MSETVNKAEYIKAIASYLQAKEAVEEDAALCALVNEQVSLTAQLMQLLKSAQYDNARSMSLSREISRIQGLLEENTTWLRFHKAEECAKNVLKDYACGGSCDNCQMDCPGKTVKE